MRKHQFYSSDLICSECGSIFTIPRSFNQKRGKYHIKDIACYKCNKVTKFIELEDAKTVKKELEFLLPLDKQEQLVYDLLHMNDEKEQEKQYVR